MEYMEQKMDELIEASLYMEADLHAEDAADGEGHGDIWTNEDESAEIERQIIDDACRSVQVLDKFYWRMNENNTHNFFFASGFNKKT